MITLTEQQRLEQRIEAAGWTWWEILTTRRAGGQRMSVGEPQAYVSVRNGDSLLWSTEDSSTARCWESAREWLDDRQWWLYSLGIDRPVPLELGGATITIRAACMRRINGELHVPKSGRSSSSSSRW